MINKINELAYPPTESDLEQHQCNNLTINTLVIKAADEFMRLNIFRFDDLSIFCGEISGTHGLKLQDKIVELLEHEMAREITLYNQKAKERFDYLSEEIDCGLDGGLHE